MKPCVSFEPLVLRSRPDRGHQQTSSIDKGPNCSGKRHLINATFRMRLAVIVVIMCQNRSGMRTQAVKIRGRRSVRSPNETGCRLQYSRARQTDKETTGENLRAIAHITRQTTTNTFRHNLSARTESRIPSQAALDPFAIRRSNYEASA
jgi:hypothetical protein